MEKEFHTTIINSDEPVQVKIGGDNRWFRMFSSVVDSGVWARLSPSAAKVLVTIAKYGDSVWMAFPGISTIQGVTGISRRSVYYAIEELEKAGVLIRRVRGGGIQSTVYQLLPPIIPRDLFNQKGLTFETGGCNPLHGGGATHCTKGVQPIAPELDQLTRTAAAAPKPDLRRPLKVSDSAAAGFSSEIKKYLLSVGIGEPVRSEISSSGLSLEKIKTVVSRWRSSGKNLGALVLNLRTAVEQIPLEKEKVSRSRFQSDRPEDIQRRVDAENQKILDWYHGLDSSVESALRLEALGSFSDFESRLVGTKSPIESPLLLGAMWRLSGASSRL